MGLEQMTAVSLTRFASPRNTDVTFDSPAQGVATGPGVLSPSKGGRVDGIFRGGVVADVVKPFGNLADDAMYVLVARRSEQGPVLQHNVDFGRAENVPYGMSSGISP